MYRYNGGNVLSDYIHRLELLYNNAFSNARKLNEGSVSEVDLLGVQHFNREMSVFMSVKTLLFALDKIGGIRELNIEFVSEILPPLKTEMINEIGSVYGEEAHVFIRFALFQSYFSQVESTYRIIKRKKHNAPNEKRNPFKLISEEYTSLSIEGDDGKSFTDFIRAIRNTIHNNGFYFPDYSNEGFEYVFKGVVCLFEYGEPINWLTSNLIFDIIDFIQGETKVLFENEVLSSIEFP